MAKTQKTRAPKISLLGSETLLGRELEEVLKGMPSAPRVTNYSANGEGNFADADGEAVYRDPLEPHSLEGEQAVIVAGTAEGAKKVYQLVKLANGTPTVIDGTYHLEHEAEARIVAPLLDDVGAEGSWLLIAAHPAALAIAFTLTRLAKRQPIRQAVVTVFEPASERGKTGASELHQQTTSLLAFKPLEKKIFDEQLAFNLLAAYGEDSAEKLSVIEQRIERHLATLLSRQMGAKPSPMPSLRVIQVPVFHGYSISAWIEFEANTSVSAIEEALASAQIEVRGADLDVPTAIGAAGQSGLMAGDIRIDRNNPRAAWIWIVGDNLHLTAESIAALLRPTEASLSS